MQNVGPFALLQSENDMNNSGSNYPLLVTQKECQLIRSPSKGYTWTNKKCNDIAFFLYWHFEISWFQTNFTRFCISQKKSQESQNRCISPVKHKMCIMLVSKENLVSCLSGNFQKHFIGIAEKHEGKAIILQNSGTDYFAKRLQGS